MSYRQGARVGSEQRCWTWGWRNGLPGASIWGGEDRGHPASPTSAPHTSPISLNTASLPQAPRILHLLEGSSYLSSSQTSIHSLKPWLRCPCFQEVLSDSPSQCLQPGIPASRKSSLIPPASVSNLASLGACVEGLGPCSGGQCTSWITERGVNPPGG